MSQMPSLALHPLLLLPTLLGVIAYALYRRIHLHQTRKATALKHNCQPLHHRYPHKDPVFGADLMYALLKQMQSHTLLSSGHDWHKRYGNTFSAILFPYATIFTTEAKNLQTALSLNFKDWSIGNREGFMGPLLGRSIFTTEGEEWHASRGMMRPQFARDQVADLQQMEGHVQKLLDLVEASKGEVIDLQELMFKLSIDSATEFLFGKSTGSLDGVDRAGAEFIQAYKWSAEAAYRRGTMNTFYPLSPHPHEKEALKVVHQWVDNVVDEALRDQKANEEKTKDGRYVFLHELIKATKDRRKLRSEVLSLLLAGRDSTATLLSNLFFELARRPDVWSKLQAEIASLASNPPDYTQLKNLPYLRWCLNEALRLYTPAPLLSRVARTDTILPSGGGANGQSPLFINKGTLCIFDLYTMHRRKDYFGEDAEEFRPERWEKLRTSWEYLPFSGGPRICLGQQFALVEASYVIVRFLQEFKRIESRDPEPWMEKVEMTVTSFNGVKVAVS